MGSARKAAKGLQPPSTPKRCVEYIRGSHLISAFPTREHRLEAAFWALCAGGVDYCSGLSSFGVGESVCFKLLAQCIRSDLIPIFKEGYFETNPFQRVLKLDVNSLVRRILGVKHSKPRNNSITYAKYLMKRRSA